MVESVFTLQKERLSNRPIHVVKTCFQTLSAHFLKRENGLAIACVKVKKSRLAKGCKKVRLESVCACNR